MFEPLLFGGGFGTRQCMKSRVCVLALRELRAARAALFSLFLMCVCAWK